MRKLQSVTLITATLASGLMAGLFAAFSYAVMPGLHRTDDKAFVAAMQGINESILNPLFMSIYMGGLILAIAAVVLCWRGGARAALPWIIAGTLLYLVMFIVTSGFNVPLNDDLVAAGDPDKIANVAQVRERFEDDWVIWNIVRAVANTAAFGSLLWALVLHGRTSGAPRTRAAAVPAEHAHPAYSHGGPAR